MSTVTKKTFGGAFRPVEIAAFWGAVGFPFVWVWFLFLDDEQADFTTTLGLIGLNAAVLYVGHDAV